MVICGNCNKNINIFLENKRRCSRCNKEISDNCICNGLIETYRIRVIKCYCMETVELFYKNYSYVEGINEKKYIKFNKRIHDKKSIFKRRLGAISGGQE